MFRNIAELRIFISPKYIYITYRLEVLELRNTNASLHNTEGQTDQHLVTGPPAAQSSDLIIEALNLIRL